MRRAIAVLICLLPPSALAQNPAQICVRDSAQRAVTGATIRFGTETLGTTGADGCASIEVTSASSQGITIQAAGFASATTQLAPGSHVTVTLQPATQNQVLVVTAARTPLALDASASSVVSLSGSSLEDTPGFTLDDQLRQVGGFQLYRRSSSWAANPTAQGISLRGLGSSSASRTLVISDQVPLLDPFNASVHWNEIPALATQSVEVMRGGASDLYGSSAIGGVIQLLPVTPSTNGYALDAYGGGLGTYALNTLGTASRGRWSVLAAGGYFHTDGYIPVPEPYRGTADADANVHFQNGRIELRYASPRGTALFLRGNLLNEARQNGTQLQTNATRIWRYAAGGDWSDAAWGHALVRVYGSDENYRQSFSSIPSDRDSETLTRLQRVPAQELGAAAQWAQTYFHALTLVAGADVRDIRGDDRETPITAGVYQPQVSISARQRYTGVYGLALWLPRNWSLSLSSRLDHFATFNGIKTTADTPGSIPQPTISQTLYNPRLGVVRQLSRRFSLTGSVFRAYRGPTLNELYRTGQVGQTTMLANPNLQSERATGYELGALLTANRYGTLRGSYFWTEVDRPITNLIISQSGSTIVEMRENLGQIRSRGISAEYDARPLPPLLITVGYQYAKATVTQFDPEPSLVGTWTPEVPRNTFSGSIQLHSPRWGSLNFFAYSSGREYDASGNQFELTSYSRFDVEASHQLRYGWSAYVSVQNLLDRTIEVGRTPVLTVGTPQLLIVGLRRQQSSD
jgi:outer membrane receptor protein involved in Fe transport